MTAAEMDRFIHQTCIYESDEQFLAMAVPFIDDGLTRGDPVLVVTNSANLRLLRRVLSPRARQPDYAETAYFGRRTARRVSAFHRYWKRYEGETAIDGHVRILAEPVWTGRSAEDIADWYRMEAGLNAVLAGTNIWMICPYDARTVSPKIVADSRRTHPTAVMGRVSEDCEEFVSPADFARAQDLPLTAPAADAAALEFNGDLSGLRRFAATQARAHGLLGERAELFIIAAGEAGTFLKEYGSGHATVRVWEDFDGIVCDFHDLASRIDDPFLGYRPPGAFDPENDGLWFIRQVCDRVELRSDGAGCTVRLYVPSARAAELALSGAAFTS